MPRGGYGAQLDLIAEPVPALRAGRRFLQGLRGYPLKVAGVALAAIVSVPVMLHGWSQLEDRLPGGLEKPANLARPIIEVRRFRPGAGWDDTHRFETSGLGEEIATGLALKLFRFRRLRIVSQWHDAGIKNAVNRSGKPPHRFILDGIVSRLDDSVQLSVQLVHAATKEKVWGERYKILGQGDLAAGQRDEKTSQIVTAIAQPDGVLDKFILSRLANAPDGAMFTENCIRRAYGYWRQLPMKELSELHVCLKKAVAGTYAAEPSAWAALALVHLDRHRAMIRTGKGSTDDPLEQAAVAANVAYELNPRSEAALRALYSVLFFRGDIEQFKRIGALAIAANPLNANTLADYGRKLAQSGEWAQGAALTRKAMRLHPYSPDWYKIVLIHDLYRRRKHRESLKLALGLRMDNFCGTHFTRAINFAALGELDKARAAARELSRVYPKFSSQAVQLFQRWNFDEVMIARFRAGMKLAGMELSDPDTM